jgi:hypothetical protein
MTRFDRARLVLAALLFLSVAGATQAQPPGDQPCALPISTCSNDTAAECPDGYQCACVPSCPDCRDCAARVCVAGPKRECRTACDCEPGLGCFDGQCIAGFAPVFCCESSQCPAGEQCQHRNGEMSECRAEPACKTACDCEPGLGCFNGECIAGIVPVFCCDSPQCTAGQRCQHRNGRMDYCGEACLPQTWGCEGAGGAANCGDDKVCACTASCPLCEDCGPGVCVPPGSPTPYRCNDDGGCAQPGDRCICVASCPECDDCVRQVCVPACRDTCEQKQRASERRLTRAIDVARRCLRDEDCVRIDTSTSCQGTCGAWVNSRMMPQVERRLRQVDAKICASFATDNCPRATPRCLNERGICERGRCTGVPE